MDVLKTFLVTAFILQLPYGLLVGGISFLFSTVLLKFSHPVIAAITKLAVLLFSFAAVIGLLYGLLRFGGVITFSSDNTISWNWFDASWRDDGFKFIYPCGCALIGIASAILVERNARRSEA